MEDGPLERDLPPRLVVIGDLSGHFSVLLRILRGLRLVREDRSWSGGRTVLVQMGDLINRGPNSRAAMEMLLSLQPEARAAGGDVVWLLGNHEVLTTLRHEAYVTAEEYAEFASDVELEPYHHARSRYLFELVGLARGGGPIPPIAGRIRLWEEENAPGKYAYRSAMGSGGRFGKVIRGLPIAVRFGKLLFVHGGLTPKYAASGLEGLSEQARAGWDEGPQGYDDLDPQALFRDPQGPLWHRAYCLAPGNSVRGELSEALELVSATQMVVGHTRTDTAPKGQLGQVLVRHAGRLVMTDVGLGEPGEAGSALVVERGRIEQWSPGGAKKRLASIRNR